MVVLTVSARWIAFHLTSRAWYENQPADESYLPEAFERDGFVHLTHGVERVLEVGNRYYRAEPGVWLLLTVDLRRMSAETRYDDPERYFPHVYGPLDRAAIVAVQVVERDASGGFVGVRNCNGR